MFMRHAASYRLLYHILWFGNFSTNGLVGRPMHFDSQQPREKATRVTVVKADETLRFRW